jgi:ABC-2 type transport system ATP-binding protein
MLQAGRLAAIGAAKATPQGGSMIQVGELPRGCHDRTAMTATDAPIATSAAPDVRTRSDPAGISALSIAGVSHCYGARRALIDIDFTVEPSRFTALLGLNGAGKSTLFSLVTRLFGIQAGNISIFGHDIGREPGEALRLLGVVFQPRTLDLDLSVMQNLLYHAALHGIDRREARLRGAEVLARIDLADRANSKVRDLSGGQMRRLEIARALLHRPRLLLLDEATVGLDVKARADILDHVRRLVSEQSIGVLWATHLLDEIVAGDDLVVLHQGRMLARGPVGRIVAEAGTHDLNAAFMRLTGTTAAIGGLAP